MVTTAAAWLEIIRVFGQCARSTTSPTFAAIYLMRKFRQADRCIGPSFFSFFAHTRTPASPPITVYALLTVCAVLAEFRGDWNSCWEKRKTRVIFWNDLGAGCVCSGTRLAGCCAIVVMRSIDRLACFSTRLKVSQGRQTWYHCICCI